MKHVHFNILHPGDFNYYIQHEKGTYTYKQMKKKKKSNSKICFMTKQRKKLKDPQFSVGDASTHSRRYWRVLIIPQKVKDWQFRVSQNPLTLKRLTEAKFLGIAENFFKANDYSQKSPKDPIGPFLL